MDKSFEDRVSEITKEILLGIKLSMPAKVLNVSEYSSSQVIDVLPLIHHLDEDGEAVELPPIYRVMVCLPEAGGALISLPVKVGDKVRLDFSRSGLDSYLSSAGKNPSTPQDKRTFALTDCFATLGCPTISTNLKPNPDDVEVKFAGSSWKLKPTGDVSLDVAGGYEVNVANGTTRNSDETHNGDLVRNGDRTQTGNDTVTGNGTYTGVVSATSFSGSGGGAVQATVDIETTENVEAATYSVGGVAGVSGTFSNSITVINGIVTGGT